MADSDFWHDLATEFQRLHETYGSLRYECVYIVDSGPVGDWRFAGSASGSIRTHFQVLAAHGAGSGEIANDGTTDLVIAWLEALRRDGSGFLLGSRFTERNTDGGETIHQTGSIFDVCEASANLCRTLELRALQAEFKEKHPAIASVPTAIPSELDEEIERRRKLLADYKAATGVTSNRPIYEAENSAIHKPQFYQWLKGSLPRHSATAINFERFLREKKPPFR